MALRPLFCLFLSGHLRQVSLCMDTALLRHEVFHGSSVWLCSLELSHKSYTGVQTDPCV